MFFFCITTSILLQWFPLNLIPLRRPDLMGPFYVFFPFLFLHSLYLQPIPSLIWSLFACFPLTSSWFPSICSSSLSPAWTWAWCALHEVFINFHHLRFTPDWIEIIKIGLFCKISATINQQSSFRFSQSSFELRARSGLRAQGSGSRRSELNEIEKFAWSGWRSLGYKSLWICNYFRTGVLVYKCTYLPSKYT